MSTGAKGARMAARALLALIERPRAGGLPITVSRGPSALVSLDVGALP